MISHKSSALPRKRFQFLTGVNFASSAAIAEVCLQLSAGEVF